MTWAKKWGHGTQPQGVANTSTGLTQGFIKRVKLCLGLECRTKPQPDRGPEVVRAGTGTSPAATAHRDG